MRYFTKISFSLAVISFASLVGDFALAKAKPAHTQSLPPEENNIVTVAGTDLEIGDGGPATAALLNLSAGIVFDSAGNGYITEGNGHRIRKVVPGANGFLDGALDEIITTFAGLGGSGFNGDNIQATAAQLNLPRGGVFDLSRDNLYVPENAGHRIRRINLATGIITTVAGTGERGSSGNGGPATAAKINAPGFAAFDSLGNLYITEVSGFLVRKIVPGANGIIDGAADEIITTVAGNGTVCPLPTTNPCGDNGPALAAQFNNPNSVSIDAAGNLYIAEGTNRVRKVTRSPDSPLGDGNIDGDIDEIITTVAGTGAVCPVSTNPCGDGGLAKDAVFNGPRTATIDPSSGNLYIADFLNRRVRFVNLGQTAINILNQTVQPGHITTIAGTGAVGPPGGGDGFPASAATLNAPNNVYFDSAGDIYIAESLGQRIRKVSKATGIITTVVGGGIFVPGDDGPATAAQFNPAGDVAFDPSGNLYIADLGNNRIRKVDRVTGIITTVAGMGPSGSTGNGDPATAALLNGPAAIAFDTGGNLFIADLTGRQIRRVVPGSNGVIDGAPDEIITLIAGTGQLGPVGDGGLATAARIFGPQGLAFDSAGNLFVSEVNSNIVRKIVPGANGVLDGGLDGPNDEIITTIAGTGATAGPSGDGFPATAAQISTPQGVAFDSAGNLYITDVGNNRIRKVVPGTGGIDGLVKPISGVCPAPTTEPVTIGLINWCRDPGEFITSVVNPLGTAGFSGDGGLATGAKLNIPQGVAVDASGNLYIADVGNNRVRFVNLGTTTTIISGQTVLAGHITTLVNQTPGTVGFSGDGDLAIAAQLNGPRGVSFDSAGNLHINDSANSRIRRLNVATPVIEIQHAQDDAAQITAILQFPADRDAGDVQRDSVMIQAIDPSHGALRAIDTDDDDLLDDVLETLAKERDVGNMNQLKVKFDKATVLDWADGGSLDIRVEGQFQDGRYFSGDTSVNIVQ